MPPAARAAPIPSHGISGYWQRNTGSGWVNVTYDGSHNYPSTTVAASVNGAYGGVVSASLWMTNVTSADAGSYHLVITNSPNGVALNSATSAVATISFVTPPANSFASAVLSGGYGAIAYWPLDETNDPSTGTTEAYEMIGGYNGIYGADANNGGGNSVLNPLSIYPGPVAGPSPASGFTGFPAGNGALGSLQGTLVNTYVNTAATPVFPANTTNATILAWVYPNISSEAAFTGIAVMRGGGLMDGLAYGASANRLGYLWNGGGLTASQAATTNFSGPAIPSNTWSMVAVVITPSNSMFYVCNTNNGMSLTNQNHDQFGRGNHQLLSKLGRPHGHRLRHVQLD